MVLKVTLACVSGKGRRSSEPNCFLSAFRPKLSLSQPSVYKKGAIDNCLSNLIRRPKRLDLNFENYNFRYAYNERETEQVDLMFAVRLI